MKKIYLALVLCTSLASAQNPYSLNGNRSEEEVQQVLYDGYLRQQKINQHIDEINRRTQQSIDNLDDALMKAILQARPKRQPENQSEGRTQTPRGGIMFSVDEPHTRSSNNRQRQRQEQQRRNQDAENRRRLARQKAEIEAQERRAEERARIAEQRRLKREHEERLHRELYQRTYAQEYANAGVRSAQLSNGAYWRTHEGADMLDATHSSSNLMYSNIEANFNSGGVPMGKHKMRPLRQRRPAITGLDPHAKPWGTFREWKAIPIEDKCTERVLPLPVDTVPPIVVRSLSGWAKLEDELTPDLLSNLRMALYHEFNGDIPPLVYDESTGNRSLYQHSSHKIITISPDGSELTVHMLEEKDDSFKKIYDNITKSTTISASYNALDKIKGEAYFTPGKQEAGGKFSAYGAGLDISESGIGVNAGDAHADVITTKKDQKGISVTYTDKEKVNIGKMIAENDKPKNGKDNDSDKNKEDLLKGELSAKIKFCENSTTIHHRKYYLSSNSWTPSFAIGGNVGVGIESGASVTASVHATKKGELKAGAKYEIEATLARGGVDITFMLKPPGYNGMCFLKAEAGAKAGYSYTMKRGGQKSLEVGVGRNLGALPIVLTGNGNLTCYNTKEVNNAYEAEKKKGL